MIKNTLFLLVLILNACSGCRHTLPDTYKGRQVAVGSGGGFTGITTTYYLLENGKLFRKTNRDTTYTVLDKIKATQRKQLFSAVLDTCQIKTTPYNQPGNVSRFVVFQNGDETHRVTWATGDTAVPASYPKFYQSFMSMLPAPDQRN
ncbi:MAG: FAD-binding oxidoreductase [Spirosoma sp.]|nr:FAD-binding oxidoreductase [Spirosoma sp.]